MNKETEKMLEDVLGKSGADMQELVGVLVLALISDPKDCKRILKDVTELDMVRNLSKNLPVLLESLGLIKTLKRLLGQQMTIVDNLSRDVTAWDRNQVIELYKAFAGLKGFGISMKS